jgi:hypothetical protein
MICDVYRGTIEMNLRAKSFLLYLILAAYSRLAIGCTPPTPDLRTVDVRVKERYEKSSDVFRAKILSTSQSEIEKDGHKAVVERVKFKIEKVYKGKKKVNEIFETETTIFEDPYFRCGETEISVLNKPVWLEIPPGLPAVFSSEWLIYSDSKNERKIKSPSKPVHFKYLDDDVSVIEKFFGR